MSTPAQIGRNEYRAAVSKAREANRETRKEIRKILAETNSNLVRALISNVLLALSENDDALDRLDEIGRNSRQTT